MDGRSCPIAFSGRGWKFTPAFPVATHSSKRPVFSLLPGESYSLHGLFAPSSDTMLAYLHEHDNTTAVQRMLYAETTNPDALPGVG